MRSIWLLAAWATMSSALVVTSPQPNYKLPIGTPFQVAWQTLGTTFPGVINVYLLSSSSPADIVTVVQTGISDQLGQFAITVPQVQPNTYYLHLADTSPNQGDYVAGPFYFTNSVTVPSASSGSPQFPVWIIPIIIVLVLAKIACILLCLWRVGYLASCGNRLFRKGRVTYQYQRPDDEVNPSGYYYQPTYQDQNYQMQSYQVDSYVPQTSYAPQPHQPHLVTYSPPSPPPPQWKSTNDYY